jgi:hypothetical protein
MSEESHDFDRSFMAEARERRELRNETAVMRLHSQEIAELYYEIYRLRKDIILLEKMLQAHEQSEFGHRC